MPETQPSLSEEDFITIHNRTQLLPWWIRCLNWVFLLAGIAAPVTFALGLAGYYYNIRLYGLTTNEPLSVTAIGLLVINMLNGITAYGLLTERDWAVNFGIVNALLGIALCVYASANPGDYPVPGVTFSLSNIRLELVVLILFLVKLLLIRHAWKQTPA